MTEYRASLYCVLAIHHIAIAGRSATYSL